MYTLSLSVFSKQRQMKCLLIVVSKKSLIIAQMIAVSLYVFARSIKTINAFAKM